MKTIYLFSLVALLFASGIGCKKSQTTTPPPDDDTTVSGSVNIHLIGKGQGESTGPILWTNWTPTSLPGIKGGEASSIFYSGNVYVGGRTWMDNAQTKFAPCYWLNGTRNDLPLLDPRGVGMVEGIAGGNGKALAVGTATDSLEFHANNGWRYLPTLWKGGTETVVLDRLDNFGGGFAHCLSWVDGGNIVVTFIGGSSKGSSGYDEPCYWAYGLGATEEDNIKAHALSSFGYGGSADAVWTYLAAAQQGNAHNTDFYFAGYVDNDVNGALMNIPCYWYKGVRADLSKPDPNAHGRATAIGFDGTPPVGTVYVVGNIIQNSMSSPCMWKNGNRTDLPVPDKNNGGGEARSVKVHKGDVYIGGFVYESDGTPRPCYWKNGELKYDKTIFGTVSAMDISLK